MKNWGQSSGLIAPRAVSRLEESPEFLKQKYSLKPCLFPGRRSPQIIEKNIGERLNWLRALLGGSRDGHAPHDGSRRASLARGVGPRVRIAPTPGPSRPLGRPGATHTGSSEAPPTLGSTTLVGGPPKRNAKKSGSGYEKAQRNRRPTSRSPAEASKREAPGTHGRPQKAPCRRRTARWSLCGRARSCHAQDGITAHAGAQRQQRFQHIFAQPEARRF